MSSPMEHVTTGGTGQNTDIDTASEVVTADQKCKRVMFKALPGNGAVVYVGLGTVTTTDGWPLSAGEESPWFEVGNINEVQAIAAAINQGLAYIWDQ